MKHDTSIPLSLHTEKRDEIYGYLGSFWSSLFKDTELVDDTLAARVLSASQLYIDVLEALSLRDHTGIPVFHRKHWHPIVIRKSQQNTGAGLRMCMPDKAVIGPQTQDLNPDHVYTEGEVFTVGGNASYSKVNTYPIASSVECPVVGVKTCICDSISSPRHILIADVDFAIHDGVLSVRKEKDPFLVDGYLLTPDGEDTLAVMWACDAELDTNNVGDFLSYPLGIDSSSDEQSSKMLSALWDVLVFGVTPLHLNRAIGAIFGVDTFKSDAVIESVSEEDAYGMRKVVTSDNVYIIDSDRINPVIAEGATVPAGTFMTTDISIHWGLSQNEVDSLITDGTLPNLAIPAGGVLGVQEPVVLENIDSRSEDGWWFKLNKLDTADSQFWTAVFARTKEDERKRIFYSLVNGGTSSEPTVNPLRALGYSVLSNVILVVTSRGMLDSVCARTVFEMLCKLVPSFATIMTIQFFTVDDSEEQPDESFVSVPGSESESLGISMQNEEEDAADDSVSFMFVPYAKTEV